ncbi:MAG: amidophosphoribosyltransferase [Dehalogenimonas sp.]|uniref:Amidophosphoribosyltransferase n=1 Tax=Candidatus Dehalogenimonas loeffleri TaxID=3127115 RepID=A0ABZ2J215_9CHLR|nr:amidophosphoribosyltransferase [Dehalogenimonas sp.]
MKWPLSSESPREECGVFGIYAPAEEVARISFFALFSLQHRGQESSGIATADGKTIFFHARMGLVSQVFTEKALNKLNGHIAIGHNRYSTAGSSCSQNAQPVLVGQGDNQMALAHNGNITNAEPLRRELEELGYEFHTTTDSEVIANLIMAAPYADLTERIRHAMGRLQGAYSGTILTRDTLYAMRDPLGVRPLCLGTIGNNGWVVSSETCALGHIGADLVREIEPGEIIRINANGLESYKENSDKQALCIFEYIYFARPDSIMNDRLLYSARKAMGAELAKEFPVEADLVIGVPDSATPAGAGYALESGIPPAEGLIKNRYMGRTFIEPTQRIRDLGVKLKFNPLKSVLDGKRVVLVDDSIVRGTTTPQVIKLLKRAGAKEVHMRVCAPPICHPCFFGVDMASRRELIAAQMTVPEIKDYIGADSLGFLSVDGLIRAVGAPKDRFCLACFTGEYPVPVQLEMDKLALEGMTARRKKGSITETLGAEEVSAVNY